MRPLAPLLLLWLAAAGALLSSPGAELWVELVPVQWPPVLAAVYRSVQLASRCQCRLACAADLRCQAVRARRLQEGGFSCSMASRRRGAATAVQQVPDAEHGGWWERAGPPDDPELVCWPEDETEAACRPPTDCAELRRAGITASGPYSVSVSDGRDVFCDMQTDGGGWTLLQRRGAPDLTTDFARSLYQYVSGFGDPLREHWLGLAAAARLAALRPQLIRVDGWRRLDAEPEETLWYAVYGPITLLDAAGDYRLLAPWLDGNTTAELVSGGEANFTATCASWLCRDDAGWWYSPTYSFAQTKGTNLNGVQALSEKVALRWAVPGGTAFYPNRTEIKMRDADF